MIIGIMTLQNIIIIGLQMASKESTSIHNYVGYPVVQLFNRSTCSAMPLTCTYQLARMSAFP